MYATDLAPRRARILEAMVVLVCERGFAGVTVAVLCARARVSRWGFYAEFASLEDCFCVVLDEGRRQASALIADALSPDDEETVRDLPGVFAGVRRALVALLAFMDERPALARVWLVESQAAGAWALERRERNVTLLTEQILAACVASGEAPQAPAHVAEAVMAAVLGLLKRRLLTGTSEPLLTLLGPLMDTISRPYLRAAAASEQGQDAALLAAALLAARRTRPHAEPTADPESPGGSREADARKRAAAATTPLPALLANPRSRRARQCLLCLAERPGASNRQIAEAIAMVSPTQASRLLARLERAGLLDKCAGGAGRANQWSLTEQGQSVARTLGSLSRPATTACRERLIDECRGAPLPTVHERV